jgi:hypothetical protein
LRTRAARADPKMAPVSPDTHTRLVLELDLAGGPLRGVVLDVHGHAEPFAGWMALIRTIELNLDAARRASVAVEGK